MKLDVDGFRGKFAAMILAGNVNVKAKSTVKYKLISTLIMVEYDSFQLGLLLSRYLIHLSVWGYLIPTHSHQQR